MKKKIIIIGIIILLLISMIGIFIYGYRKNKPVEKEQVVIGQTTTQKEEKIVYKISEEEREKLETLIKGNKKISDEESYQAYTYSIYDNYTLAYTPYFATMIKKQNDKILMYNITEWKEIPQDEERVIYTKEKLQKGKVKEYYPMSIYKAPEQIKRFDNWLKNTYPNIYKNTDERTYIEVGDNAYIVVRTHKKKYLFVYRNNEYRVMDLTDKKIDEELGRIRQ